MGIRTLVMSLAVVALASVAACEINAPVGDSPDTGSAPSGSDSGLVGPGDGATASSADTGTANAADGALPADGDAGSAAGLDASSAAGPDAATTNPGHTEDRGGVMHKPGATDPKTNCVACHGADLKGGSGPSCYNCHNSNDHTINRLGTMHRSGTTSSCNTCHGPGNTGGLGPACSTCH
jgi:DnaJ-class molecular chaperone